MPIRIPKNLPAFNALSNENIFVMPSETADKQDIRPLRILLLNLMPLKEVTETQFLRLLSNAPLQVDIEFLTVKSHTSKNTPKSYMDTFYKIFDEIKEDFFDGFIITGAPVEHLPFEKVDYWSELCKIMEWSKSHVQSTLHICWGAQAGLYYHFGIPKYTLSKKLSGIFTHKLSSPKSILIKGFDDYFYAPHSRYTEIRAEDIAKTPQLTVIAESDIAGVHLIKLDGCRQVFITGHCEYDRETLAEEYKRDVAKGLDIDIPCNYFPNDNPNEKPLFTWSAQANLLFSNWLNYCVYQSTPFDITKITKI
ncbi:MAG: homoserine O-succinyltransferase [Oscillospiraceae bacterium]|nr:homoserine O-succinyltransferase [Oscillospiraceae bacterium]